MRRGVVWCSTAGERHVCLACGFPRGGARAGLGRVGDVREGWDICMYVCMYGMCCAAMVGWMVLQLGIRGYVLVMDRMVVRRAVVEVSSTHVQRGGKSRL